MFVHIWDTLFVDILCILFVTPTKDYLKGQYDDLAEKDLVFVLVSYYDLL